jgi:hypothetical protein
MMLSVVPAPGRGIGDHARCSKETNRDTEDPAWEQRHLARSRVMAREAMVREVMAREVMAREVTAREVMARESRKRAIQESSDPGIQRSRSPKAPGLEHGTHHPEYWTVGGRFSP